MKRLLLTIFLMIWSSAHADLVVIGDTTTASTVNSGIGNNTSYIRGPIAVPAVGTIVFDSVRIYASNASTPNAGNPDTSTIAWYADNSGVPGSQIYKDTVIISSSTAWYKGIKTMSLSFSSGTYANLWVAFGGTTNDSASNIAGHSAASTGCYTFTGAGVPPSVWPACTPSSANSFMIALYGHTSGGGPGPSPSTRNLLIRKIGAMLTPNVSWADEPVDNWRWRS